jgi:hypothetical protein
METAPLWRPLRCHRSAAASATRSININQRRVIVGARKKGRKEECGFDPRAIL